MHEVKVRDAGELDHALERQELSVDDARGDVELGPELRHLVEHGEDRRAPLRVQHPEERVRADGDRGPLETADLVDKQGVTSGEEAVVPAEHADALQKVLETERSLVGPVGRHVEDNRTEGLVRHGLRKADVARVNGVIRARVEDAAVRKAGKAVAVLAEEGMLEEALEGEGGDVLAPLQSVERRVPPRVNDASEKGEANGVTQIAVALPLLGADALVDDGAVVEDFVVRDDTSVDTVVTTVLLLARHGGGQAEADRLLPAERVSAHVGHAGEVDGGLPRAVALRSEAESLGGLLRAVWERGAGEIGGAAGNLPEHLLQAGSGAGADDVNADARGLENI